MSASHLRHLRTKAFVGRSLSGLFAVGTSACYSTSTLAAAPPSDRSQRRGSYSPISLKGKVVLITGATAGIGESCAWRFAEEGCKLVLISRRVDRLNTLKKNLEEEYTGLQIHVEVII